MKQILIGIVELFHLLFAIILIMGGYIIPYRYIPVYLLFLPYIVIDWNDKDGLCWLTKLRNMIKYESIYPKVKDENENNFIYNIVHKFGITMKYERFTFILYVGFIASWLYAYFRLMSHFKIDVLPNNMTKYMVFFLIIGWIVVTIPSYI